MGGKLPAGFPGQLTWDDIPIAMILTDENGLVKGWNSAAEKILPTGNRMDRPLKELLQAKESNLTMVLKRDGFHGFLHLWLASEVPVPTQEAIAIAADMAHEIRNPLGSIELFASLLHKSLTRPGDVRRVEQILSSVRLINERITGLIEAIKKRSVRRETFSLTGLLKEMVGPSELCESFLVFNADPEEVWVIGDEKMIRQMFLSVMIGLLSSIPEEGRLEIKVTLNQSDGKQFGEVDFRAIHSKDFLPVSDMVKNLPLPVLHHVAQLHDGSVRLEANRITISLPVER